MILTVGADSMAVMALEMRTECERCSTALTWQDAARICSYECTFCPSCTSEMQAVCPNCGGELVTRPRRATAAPQGT